MGRRAGDRLCRPARDAAVADAARHHRQYPEIAAIALELEGREAVLDGELVAYDEDGRPSFQRLQRRMHVASEAEVRKRRADVPVTYVIFDLLHLDGESLLDLPYEERRERLEALDLDGESWQTPVLPPRRRRGDARGQQGAGARGHRRQAARLALPAGQAQPRLAQGQELPRPGGRDRRLAARQGAPRRRDRLAPRRLLRGRAATLQRFAGKVGTGFSDDELRMLGERLRPLRRETSPFEGRQPQKAMRSSPSRSWSPRSSSPSGRTPGRCAIPPTRACATTSRRRTSCERSGRPFQVAHPGSGTMSNRIEERAWLRQHAT